MLFLYFAFILISSIHSQTVVTDPKLDNLELKCLVCEASINELSTAISKIDPEKTVDVGGHRLDAKGNYKSKTVAQSKSELHLSELIENICGTMDNYVRGLWKSNGTLTVLKMVADNGMMTPYMSDIDFVQDEDLNKSLKYYCETIMEEFEEDVIKLYQNDEKDIVTKFCKGTSGLCPNKKASINEEL